MSTKRRLFDDEESDNESTTTSSTSSSTKRVKNSFVEDERALHRLCSSGTVDQVKEAYNAIINNRDYMESYIIVGCDPTEGVIAFLKPCNKCITCSVFKQLVYSSKLIFVCLFQKK